MSLICSGSIYPSWKNYSDGKIKKKTTEGRPSLGRWGQFRALLKPLGTSRHYYMEGFKGGPQSGPHYAEKRKPLVQPRYVFPSVCLFISENN